VRGQLGFLVHFASKGKRFPDAAIHLDGIRDGEL